MKYAFNQHGERAHWHFDDGQHTLCGHWIGYGWERLDSNLDLESLSNQTIKPFCSYCIRKAKKTGMAIEGSSLELNDIARAMCDSEAFMWLMVGANHPESHLALLRKVWREHYLPAGGGYGKRVRG